MNFARLNHVLIPGTREERDRFRKSFLGRLSRPLALPYFVFSRPGRFLVVLCLFIAVAGVDIEVSDVYMLFSVLVGLLGASLVLRPLFDPKGVEATLGCAPRVAVGAPLRFTLTVHNKGTRSFSALAPRLPFLPWDGKWQRPIPRALPLGASESVRFEATARFIERGAHDLDPFQVGVVVPMGLCLGPAYESSGARFLVVPNLANVVDVMALTQRRSDSQGSASSGALGDAQELHGVREYVRGDRIRTLHARTWARTGRPHVRQYRQQHTAHIAILLALSEKALSEEALEAAVMLVAGLVGYAFRGDALIDLVVPGTRSRTLTLGRGFGTLDQALDVLATAKPSASETPDEWQRLLAPIADGIATLLAVSADNGDSAEAVHAWALERRVQCQVYRVEGGRRSSKKTAAEGPATRQSTAFQSIQVRDVLEQKPLHL